MKIVKIIIIIIGLISLLMLCIIFMGRHLERNKLIFKDPVEQVQDSIKVMIGLLDKMKSNADGIKNYYFDDANCFYVNAQRLFVITQNTRILLDTFYAFKDFNKEEMERFIKLTSYLNDNYINDGGMNSFGGYKFDYREMPENEFVQLRYIIYWENENESLPSDGVIEWEILDKRSKLILVKPVRIDLKR
jgi:hypothetical protein